MEKSTAAKVLMVIGGILMTIGAVIGLTPSTYENCGTPWFQTCVPQAQAGNLSASLTILALGVVTLIAGIVMSTKKTT